MAYIEGKNRNEIRFKCLDEEISQNSKVRVIDALIDLYDKEFGKVRDKKVGRNAFDPKALMKLLVYGYIHNTRSSRKLAEACKINIESWENRGRGCIFLTHLRHKIYGKSHREYKRLIENLTRIKLACLILM